MRRIGIIVIILVMLFSGIVKAEGGLYLGEFDGMSSSVKLEDLMQYKGIEIYTIAQGFSSTSCYLAIRVDDETSEDKIIRVSLESQNDYFGTGEKYFHVKVNIGDRDEIVATGEANKNWSNVGSLFVNITDDFINIYWDAELLWSIGMNEIIEHFEINNIESVYFGTFYTNCSKVDIYAYGENEYPIGFEPEGVKICPGGWIQLANLKWTENSYNITAGEYPVEYVKTDYYWDGTVLRRTTEQLNPGESLEMNVKGGGQSQRIEVTRGVIYVQYDDEIFEVYGYNQGDCSLIDPDEPGTVVPPGSDPERPKPPSGNAGWLEWIEYRIADMTYTLTLPFRMIGTIIQTLVETLAEVFSYITQLSDIWSSAFSWLPTPIIGLLVAGIACSVILRFVGR